MSKLEQELNSHGVSLKRGKVTELSENMFNQVSGGELAAWIDAWAASWTLRF